MPPAGLSSCILPDRVFPPTISSKSLDSDSHADCYGQVWGVGGGVKSLSGQAWTRCLLAVMGPIGISQPTDR